MAEHTRVTGRLAASRLGRLEAAHVHASARESVGRGQSDDPGADDGNIGSTLHRWR
jgi:hypothetical protein